MNRTIEKEDCKFQLFLNYFEIYKESLNDLLQPNRGVGENLKLNGSKILNAVTPSVKSPEEIFFYIQMGQNMVQTESTGMNERSSRSHTIMMLEYV
jgi:kinesin family protein 14